MPATIFNGAKVKALKETLSLNGASDIISSSTDPSVVAVDAPVGSLLLNNSSGKLYKKLDAGSSTNWQEVGAGAGGKNYIAKGAFDTPSTSGWSLTHSTLDATSKLPNQASGSWTAAAGTLSITTVGAGSQLSLLPYSLSLVSSAATTAGDMLITDALALDQEAQASVQTFSFFYKVASGGTNLTLSGTSTNSLAVAIYDVTNDAWIDPAGRYNVVQLSGVAKCAGTFQVPSNCTSVRLAVYFPNASAGAATVYLDDFYLGPQVVQYGAPVTDWAAYTPTFTGMGTVTAIDIQWRRVGDLVQLRGKFQTGTVTAVEARMTLPPGLTAAGTDKIPTIQVVGTMNWATSTSTGVVLQEPNVAYATFGFQNSTSNPLNKINGTTLTNNLVYSIVAAMPIAGWSSAVSMSNDTDTRVVATGVRASANVSMTANNPIVFQTVDFDRTGSYNASTGQFTVPSAGVYEMTVVGFLTVAGTSNIRPYKNGLPTQGGFIVAFNGGAPVSGSYLVDCKSGDVLTFVSDATTTLSTNSVGFFRRLSGPSVIAASETVAARYADTSGQAIGTSLGIFKFATRDFDTHGGMNTSSGVYTAAIAGKYSVDVGIFTQAILLSSTQALILAIYKNGALFSYIGQVNGNGAGVNQHIQGHEIVSLNAGDTISVYISSSVAGAANTTAGTNHFAITRIGN